MMRSLTRLATLFSSKSPLAAEITMTLPSEENATILHKLPSNILALCLNFLDAKDVVNCRKVCSALLAMVDADINLRYKVELHANYMVDGPPSTVLRGVRFHQLLEYQRCWRTCEWTTIKSMPYPALPKPDGTETTDDAILTRDVQHLGYLTWDVPLPRHLTLDLDFDDRQDLLTVLEIPEDNRSWMQLSVRHLSNGLPHRLAQKTPLATFTGGGARARIYGRYVSLFIKAEIDLECRLSLYDWKSGDSTMILWRYEIEAMTFISERYVVLAELRKLTSQLSLCIIDVHRPQNPDVCSLMLPETPGMSSSARVNVQCGPHSSPPDTYPYSDRCPLFTTDPINQLVLVTFTNAPESFALFVLASTLVTLAERHQNKPSPPTIPWQDWGPENTRLIQTAEKAGENLCVYGTKALILHEGAQVLYDFNQRNIKRELSRCNAAEVPDDIVINETSFDQGNFSTVVTTRLPYRFRSVGLDNFNNDVDVVHMGETSIVSVPDGRDIAVLSI